MIKDLEKATHYVPVFNDDVSGTDIYPYVVTDDTATRFDLWGSLVNRITPGIPKGLKPIPKGFKVTSSDGEEHTVNYHLVKL